MTHPGVAHPLADPPLLITPEEAARRLGVGRSTVYGLLRLGQLPSIKIGRCRRVPAAAVEAFVREALGADAS
jgi:excisionase family DNA binding protein